MISIQQVRHLFSDPPRPCCLRNRVLQITGRFLKGILSPRMNRVRVCFNLKMVKGNFHVPIYFIGPISRLDRLHGSIYTLRLFRRFVFLSVGVAQDGSRPESKTP